MRVAPPVSRTASTRIDTRPGNFLYNRYITRHAQLRACFHGNRPTDLRRLAAILLPSMLKILLRRKAIRITHAKARPARDGGNKLIGKRLIFEESIEVWEVSKLRHQPRQVSTTYDTSTRLMPSFFMREIRVVRLSPRRTAAPFGPPTRPSVSRSVRTICSRSDEADTTDPFIAEVPSLNSDAGTFSALPRVRITARSMKFSSSRTFPGQCHPFKRFIAPAGIVSIRFSMRRAYFWVKCRTSKGISSGLSRSGGIRMGNT